MQGFTYNGIHCSTYSVYYTPDAAARGSFFSDYDVIDEENGWTPGGNYYKSRVKSKEFSLSCFYDNVTYATRENIIRWLDRRTSGELIFDARPWAKYFVRPTKTIIANDYLQVNNGVEELYSGTFTVVFTAYHPFAELIYSSIDDCKDDEEARRFTSEINVMPDGINLPNPKPDSYAVYNMGTETGHSIVRFKGRTGSSPLKIKNSKNGTEFAIREGAITQTGEWYEANSKTGRMEKRTETGNPMIDFSVHDDGYITFEPSEYVGYYCFISGWESDKRILHVMLPDNLRIRKEELQASIQSIGKKKIGNTGTIASRKIISGDAMRKVYPNFGNDEYTLYHTMTYTLGHRAHGTFDYYYSSSSSQESCPDMAFNITPITKEGYILSATALDDYIKDAVKYIVNTNTISNIDVSFNKIVFPIYDSNGDRIYGGIGISSLIMGTYAIKNNDKQTAINAALLAADDIYNDSITYAYGTIEIEKIDVVLQKTYNEMKPTDRLIGKYVYIPVDISGGNYVYDWAIIGNVDSANWQVTLNVPVDYETNIYSPVIDVNYLTIEKASDANIEKLEIICMPEVR